MDTAKRIEILTSYLKDHSVPSQVSTADQVAWLLSLGNTLGLYDAVDYFRFVEQERKNIREETIAERYRRVADIERSAYHELEAYYLPRLCQALVEGRVEEARALYREIPDSAVQVFATDAFRQAGVAL